MAVAVTGKTAALVTGKTGATAVETGAAAAATGAAEAATGVTEVETEVTAVEIEVTAVEIEATAVEIEVHGAVAVIEEIAATVGTGVRATVDPGTTSESEEIPTTNVAVRAPTGMTTVPGKIAANVLHGDLPVAMMGADDGRVRRVDASTTPSHNIKYRQRMNTARCHRKLQLQ